MTVQSSASKISTTYETIVGMEIHVELKTASKMFCGCKNDPFRAPKPNIYTCPVCLGMPGGLPVPNRRAIELTIMLGMALNCDIPKESKFDRKNYFYPDLPKGYQISQYDQPMCVHGHVATEFGNVGITRVHLEEDTGKLLHTTLKGKPVTLIDFNRSGVALVEIVTEPNIHSAEHAKTFLKKLHQIIRYLGISEADMEKGSMRLEPNISLRPAGQKSLPEYKVEVKNINSFNYVKRAITYEERRQGELLSEGETPAQETRGYNEVKGITVPQRRKETADDYRYFPEPDIPPLCFDSEYISSLRASIPELPDDKRARFVSQYGISEYDARLLTETRETADYYEECCKTGLLQAKTIANWMVNKRIEIQKMPPNEFVGKVKAQTLTVDVSETEYDTVINNVIADNPGPVVDYKRGKEQAIMFLLGKVRSVNRNMDPKRIIELLKQKLNS